MQSSLLNQLNNLKKNQKTAPILPYKAQCSLLFDFKFANVISAEEVYEIGYQGLIELRKIDEKFEKYLKALFSSTSKYFNREMIPKSEIKTFDAKRTTKIRISKFIQYVRCYTCTNLTNKSACTI